MKKLFVISAIVLGVTLLLFGAYFIGSGFVKQPSVMIEDFTVAPDGTAMTVRLSVGSSAGYLRSAAAHEQDGTLYLDCYAAFGGINGALGRRHEFPLPLSDETVAVALNRADGSYETVLRKAEDGSWQRVR